MFKFYYEYSDYEIRAIDSVKHSRNNFHYQIYNKMANVTNATIILGLTQPLTEMSTKIFFWGTEFGWPIRLTTLPTSVSRDGLEGVDSSTSHNPIGLYGLLRG
jgi:hypothetical protein